MNLTNRIAELESIVFACKSATESVSSKTNNIEESLTFLNARVEHLGNSIETHDKEIRDVVKINTSLLKKVDLLEKKLEDQINRSCRKTLIVKGIPEEANETWEQTRNLVATQINNICKTNIEPESNIERAHRGKKTPHLHKHRDIHLCLYDWNDADSILKGFKKFGLKNREKIFIEQRYGPDTTWRRNKAMILRKQLKEEKRITSGYVAFPAKLMVKKVGDDRYTLHKDFSNTEVLD